MYVANGRLCAYMYLYEFIGEPEVTMSLNERSAQLLLHPVEEPEEDLFDDEADYSYQDVNTESEVNLKI